jgi:predicted aldo/keto reductase-like oxidoreductase
MKFRKLGRTGLEVSSVGFGALPLPGLDEEGASVVLNTALDCGMNFIDTARSYRESEELVGMAVSGRRGEFYLATKARTRREDQIMEELETSLGFLKTDRIDLYQIHFVNSSDDLEDVLSGLGALKVLKKIREKGVIDHIGVTGHDPALLLEAAKTGEFDTVQGALSYIEKPRTALDLIDYCSQNDIGFIVQKPLAGGAIINAKSALKWILQHPVSTVIPGMVLKDQVIENAAVADEDYSLTAGEIDELEKIKANLDKDFCRRCYYCHPVCPEDIRIGVILEFSGKARLPENLSVGRRWYRDYKINASHCTECGLCLAECPYELPIIDLLKEAHVLLKDPQGHQDPAK